MGVTASIPGRMFQGGPYGLDEIVFLGREDRPQIQKQFTLVDASHHGGLARTQTAGELLLADDGGSQGDDHRGQWLIGQGASTGEGGFLANRDPGQPVDLGKPCGQVVSATKTAENDHIATCKDGSRYRVYMNAEGRVVAEKK